MIKAILLDSFRSIRSPARIDLAKITVLCGPNSAGKSSVGKALEFFTKLASGKPWEADKSGAPFTTAGNTTRQDPLRIGIEFSPDINVEDGPRLEAYKNSSDPYALQLLDEFWEEHRDKVFRVVVECGGDYDNYSELLELYLDGQLILSIDNNFTFLDPLFRPVVDTGLLDDEIEQSVRGNLRIHKSLAHTSLFVFPDDPDDFPRKSIRRCIEENYGDWSITRGLSFNLFGSKPESSQTPMVDADSSNLSFFDDEKSFIDSVSSSYYNDQVLRLSKTEFRKQLREILSGDSIAALKSRFNAGLWSDAINLRRFLEGLFLRLDASLRIRYVRGERPLISSKVPYHLETLPSLVGELGFPGQDSHLRDYIQYWWKSSSTPQKSKNKSKRNSCDLVIEGLGNLMPSLGRYSFSPQIYQLTGIEGSSQYMKNLGEPLLHGLCNGVIVYPYLKAPTGTYLLDFQEVGSGISFMMPIFSALTLSPLTVVEQPELHLHPRAQCELGDVFIYAATNGKYSVVETHSEHMILRLSRRIRETSRKQLAKDGLKLHPKDALLYYFSPSQEHGTTVHKIRFDEHGEFLDLWPDGFFAERAGELFD